jgi:hypothetical protein
MAMLAAPRRRTQVYHARRHAAAAHTTPLAIASLQAEWHNAPPHPHLGHPSAAALV